MPTIEFAVAAITGCSDRKAAMTAFERFVTIPSSERIKRPYSPDHAAGVYHPIPISAENTAQLAWNAELSSALEEKLPRHLQWWRV